MARQSLPIPQAVENLALSLRVSTLCTKSLEALIAEGDAASEKGLHPPAWEAFDKAESLSPDDAEILRRIAFLESPGKRIAMSKRIRQRAKRATELDSRSHLSWHILGH